MRYPSYKVCLGKAPIDKLVLKKCDDLCRKVKDSYVKQKVDNYPPIVVGCFTTLNRYMFIETTYSSKPDYQQTPELYQKLSSLGAAIWEKRTECKFPIGHCAEPKAAFSAIMTTKSSMRLLRFSTAFRPRTKEAKPYCRNCRDTFNI